MSYCSQLYGLILTPLHEKYSSTYVAKPLPLILPADKKTPAHNIVQNRHRLLYALTSQFVFLE